MMQEKSEKTPFVSTGQNYAKYVASIDIHYTTYSINMESCTFTLFFIDKFWPTNCNRYLLNIFGYVPPNTWPTPCLRILLRRINTTAVVIIKIVIAIEKIIIKAIILLRFDFGL